MLSTVSQTSYSLGVAEVLREVLVCDGLRTIKGGLEIVVRFVGVLDYFGGRAKGVDG